MKKYIKAGLLIVTLVIPALIFTFLRFFATNHYNVPFFHAEINQGGVVKIIQRDTVYYQIPDSIQIALRGHLSVISYESESCNEPCQVMKDNLNRIYGLREGIPGLQVIALTEMSSKHTTGKKKEGWFVHEMDRNSSDHVFKWNEVPLSKKTGLAENRWMLIDRSGYIRGYYNGADTDETNRLMAEIKILSFEEQNLKN